MQTDPEGGVRTSDINRVYPCHFGDHQAGGRQNSAGVRKLHRLVHPLGPTEVIRIYDQALHDLVVRSIGRAQVDGSVSSGGCDKAL